LIGHQPAAMNCSSARAHPVRGKGPSPPRITPKAFASNLAQAWAGDAGALERVHCFLSRSHSLEQLHSQIVQRLAGTNGPGTDSPGDSLSAAEAQLVTARWYGFEHWRDFEASVTQPLSRQDLPPRGPSRPPPFYRIGRTDNSIESRPPISAGDWDEIFEVMRQHGITGLRAAGQMTDEVLERVSRLDSVTSLPIEGCRQVTDAGPGSSCEHNGPAAPEDHRLQHHRLRDGRAPPFARTA
jgi:hypothetical protein